MSAGNLSDSGSIYLLLLDKLEQKNKRVGPERKEGERANGIKDHTQERQVHESEVWNWVEIS